ncbi:MAG: formylglycine-generating enzyme family protein [Akkermansiaceae bacterium]|nr:formylglycine-generating enzyme family protein [Akkermansiaceae bacterium]
MEPHPPHLIDFRLLLAVGLVLGGQLLAAERELRLDLGADAGLDLVLVHGGAFTQGSPAEEVGRGTDEDQRQVRISADYYVSRSAVTRGQWERFVSETGYRSEAESGTSGGFGWDGTGLSQDPRFNWRNPGFPQTPEHPVCLVTFPDAQAFCSWLTRKSRRTCTLPTEAQWEYACRAGTTTPWHAGATPDDCDRIIWHQGNSGNTTHPVDSKPSNGWGLVIGGNVSEWCLDWYAPYPAGEAVDPRQDNPNLSDKPRRVLRGGSWLRAAKHSRSAVRYRADPRSRNADIGFRIVCALETTAPPAPPVRAGVPNPAPKVEAVPGDRPQRGVPTPAHRPNPVRQRPGILVRDFGVSGLLGGLVCLVVPLGVVFLLVRLISKHGRRDSGNAFLTRPKPRVPRPLIRKCGDGFWIDGDWPAGSVLRLHYVAAGIPVDTELVYRPGPGGQFVYTGTEPETVSVVPEGTAPPPVPVSEPVPLDPPAMPEPREVRPAVSPRPPVFPSAY